MGYYPLKTKSVLNGYGGCLVLPPVNEGVQLMDNKKLMDGSLIFPSPAWVLKKRCRDEDMP